MGGRQQLTVSPRADHMFCIVMVQLRHSLLRHPSKDGNTSIVSPPPTPHTPTMILTPSCPTLPRTTLLCKHETHQYRHTQPTSLMFHCQRAPHQLLVGRVTSELSSLSFASFAPLA